MDKILNLASVGAIVAGSLSLLGILIGLLFNYRENRTNRYVQIITKQTLDNNMFIRENSEIVTVLTRPEIIIEAKNNGDKNFKISLIRAEVNIEHQFKYSISQEQQMIEILRSLTKAAMQYFDCPTAELDIELRRLGKEYYEIMTIYDYADWNYIKSQAKSKAYNKQYKSFSKIYEEISAEFKDEDKPTPW